MAGALDKVLAGVAKEVVTDLGNSFKATILYRKNSAGTYNIATGAYGFTEQSYTFNAPIEFINASESEGREQQEARVYVVPEQIAGSYPDLDDELQFFPEKNLLSTQQDDSLTTQSNQLLALQNLKGDVCQITNIRMYSGKQQYLYVLMVRF